MKVLLKKDVEDLGFAGEVFTVAPGYGRNYLIPQGLAIPATDGALKQARKWMEQAAARREQQRQQFAELVERLNNTTITFTAKAGDKGKLYGSITTSDIADKLSEVMNIDVDRRKVEVDGKSLRNVGVHTASVRLDGEFMATSLKVEILSDDSADEEEDAPVEEAAVEEAAEVEEVATEEEVEAEEEAVA